jgi:anthranilate phosphoribosyltransferase
VGVRKSLAAAGHRSIFNLIGPLLNPARPECQLVGVSDRSLCPAFAEILQRLGRESAWVVSGMASGHRAVDEVSLMGSTLICKAGAYQDLEDEEINPEDFGFRKARLEDLQGGDAKTNAAILEAILSGKDTGPKCDIVLLNAAAALACAGLADHMEDAIGIARETITSGAAIERLRLLQEASSS